MNIQISTNDQKLGNHKMKNNVPQRTILITKLTKKRYD